MALVGTSPILTKMQFSTGSEAYGAVDDRGHMIPWVCMKYAPKGKPSCIVLKVYNAPVKGAYQVATVSLNTPGDTGWIRIDGDPHVTSVWLDLYWFLYRYYFSSSIWVKIVKTHY